MAAGVNTGSALDGINTTNSNNNSNGRKEYVLGNEGMRNIIAEDSNKIDNNNSYAFQHQKIPQNGRNTTTQVSKGLLL